MFRGLMISVLASATITLSTGAWLSAQAQDPAKVAGDIYKCSFENERIRLCEVTFKAGAKTAVHSHPDHVAYVIAGGKLRITGSDGKAQDIEIKAGQALWLPAQTHVGENVGNTEIKVVIVELKEKPAK